ncbi:hypothetical protein ACFX1Z_009145 [Malus domestica]
MATMQTTFSGVQHPAMMTSQPTYNVPAMMSHPVMPSSLVNMVPSHMPNQMSASTSYAMPSVSASKSTRVSQQIWLTDSGATNHMTHDLNNLSLASPYPQHDTVQTANGEGLQVTHIGDSLLRTLYKANGRILFKGLCNNGLYPIPSLAALPSAPVFSANQAITCHPSNPIVSLMLHKSKMSVVKDTSPMVCQSCMEEKFAKLPLQSVSTRSVIPFEVIHSDLWGPTPCISIDGFRYYAIFVDECTRFCWMFTLLNKLDLHSVFATFYQFVYTQCSAKIKILQNDGGGEYIGHTFQSFLTTNGIVHQKSCPYTPEQNGLAERKHKHIVETAITLLQNAKLPSKFWSYACQTATYLINRMPSSVIDHNSPFESLHSAIPDIQLLRNILVFPIEPSSSPTINVPPFPSSPIPASQSIIAQDSPAAMVPEFSTDSLQVVISIPPMNLHHMQTRSKSGIFKKKALIAPFHSDSTVDFTQTEPTTYKTALKVPVWFDVMKEEIEALHSQNTWALVNLPSQKHLVGCKWVFKIKRNADGTIARHKARLVAKGFSQEQGLDYGKTFSPVVKPTTLDVKNAFLHDILQEELYMSQPPGFEDVRYPSLVCKLHKSLYGLKQAPRAWNDRFTQFVPHLGFSNTYSDNSLFVKHVGSSIVILLLYVDDIIITSSATDAIQQVISALRKKFDIKDLGSLHFFLGIQITKTKAGLFLSQEKCIQDLLKKTKMFDSKSAAIPCLPYSRLLKDDGQPYNNPSLYRSIVGALQHLVFTRPDIAFSIHQVSQFMQAPMESHFTSVKRILRYLKGSLSTGITYTKGEMVLKSFSDADWARDPNDRRSTTGLVVFLGNNPIARSSKKQQTVSRSSTEAEYRALSSTTAELDWIQQILHFLRIKLQYTPVLFCDNMSAISLSFNLVQHQRTKHIEVDVHFV